MIAQYELTYFAYYVFHRIVKNCPPEKKNIFLVSPSYWIQFLNNFFWDILPIFQQFFSRFSCEKEPITVK